MYVHIIYMHTLIFVQNKEEIKASRNTFLQRSGGNGTLRKQGPRGPRGQKGTPGFSWRKRLTRKSRMEGTKRI